MYIDITLVSNQGDDLITIKDFIETYHPTMTVPGIVAAIEADKIDAVKPARDIFIALTKKTMDYVPRGYKTRNR